MGAVTKRSGHPRVACAVVGCARGTTTCEPLPEGGYSLETGGAHEILCGPHWRRVPRTLKRRRRLLFKAWERRGRTAGTTCYWQLKPGSPQRIGLVSAERLIRAVWQRCVSIASGECAANDDLPPGLAEELRRISL